MGGIFSEATSIALDATGNIYTTGRFTVTADFDPNAGVTNLINAGGGADIFVSKLDALGNLIWAKAMGSANGEQANSIAVDATGNVYTTGFFNGTADFDPNAGTTNLISIGGSADIFVSKLDISGNFIWARAMGGTGVDDARSIAVDATGNVYTTGYFQATADFDPSAGTTNLITATGGGASEDVFISKLNALGNFVWAKAMGGNNSEIASAIAVDIAGNVYTAGYFNSATADFDPNAGVFNLICAGNKDIFVSKLDASGNYVWAKAMSGTFTEDANAIAIDATGNVYTTGIFFGTTDFDPNAGVANLTTTTSTTAAFISKLDASGNYIWAKAILGTSSIISSSIVTDVTNNVYIAGTFDGTFDFDPNAGVANLVGAFDIFVGKYTQCPTIIISPINLTNGTVGSTYSQAITQTGLTGTPVWSVSAGALPTGLSIAGSTGIVSGTLGATGSFTFTIQATSSGCSATQSYTVIVACPVITFTNTTASGGVVNTPYTLNAGATGNNAPLTYSVSTALPAGLSINTATGVISGTPTTLTASATYIVAADPGGGCLKTTQTYTFGVTNCVPFALSPNKNFLPDGFVNVPYVGATISVAAPVAGVTYKFFKRNAINWQEGLTLNENTGVISGTPRFSTSINVVIEAVNQTTGCGSTLTSYTLVIYGDPATAVDNALENIIKVSPNPSSGDFSVDFGTINMAKSSVRVYDAQGKVVFTSENNTSASGNLMTISLEKFANGIYLMEVETSKGRILKRLAKQ